MIDRATSGAVLGLDIGGTKLGAGVLDAEGCLRSFERMPSRVGEGPSAMLSDLAALGRRAVTAAGLDAEIVGVGVGCGGPLDAEAGVVLGPPNLPGWDRVPVAAELGSLLGLPVRLDNDANLGALGEARFGVAKGVADVVYLTISTGIGGGVISAGRLVRGATGNAAELGHLCVVADGRPCACGGRGCLEAYASGTAIARRAREAVEAGGRSMLVDLAGSPDRISAETVVAALRARDALAERIWSETVELLAAGVAGAIHAFDPSLVVLGGGVAASGRLLLEPLRRAVRGRMMARLAGSVRIETSALGERLGVYGACALGAESFAGVSRRPAEPVSIALPVRESGASESGASRALAEHRAVAELVAERLPAQIDAVAEMLCAALGRGGRLITFGNGGSAADAQHFAAELIGHYKADRPSLPALALTTDPSVLTSIANDYSFSEVFARQLQALAGPEDIVVGISTSGNAPNVVRGLLAARLRGATTVALTGGDGGSAARVAQHAIVVPSRTTARTQEMHTLIVHVLSERVDEWAVAQPADSDGAGRQGRVPLLGAIVSAPGPRSRRSAGATSRHRRRQQRRPGGGLAR